MSEHVCDTGDVDRSFCPEPCGSQHVYCYGCGKRQDHCVNADPTAKSSELQTSSKLEVAAPLVEQIAAIQTAHYECQMRFQEDGAHTCDGSVIPPTYNTIAEARRAHVASQLARLAEREKANAWDEGARQQWAAGMQRVQFNPYARD